MNNDRISVERPDKRTSQNDTGRSSVSKNIIALEGG